MQAGDHRIYPRAIQLVAEGRIEYRDGRAWRDGQPAAAPEIVDEAA